MKYKIFSIICIGFLCLSFQSLNAQSGVKIKSAKSPVDYVNMYIGTINPKTRGTVPVIKVPGGNISLFPSFTPEIEDLFLADKIYGFSLPFGNMMFNSGKAKLGTKANASKFDHDMETATPYYYQVLLEDPNINVEYVLTKNTYIFRLTLPKTKESNVLLSMFNNTSFETKDNNRIEGFSVSKNRSGIENKKYFYAEFSSSFTLNEQLQKASNTEISKNNSDNKSLILNYPSTGNYTLEIKIGISSKSIAEASGYIESEVGKATFDQVKTTNKELWNKELELIRIVGGTEKQRAIFYSTLYRTRALKMGNVWDTYRCAYPLQSIIKPEETLNAIRNFIKTYEETGWLPSSGAMIGNHSTAVIVDAYMKGLRDFDIAKAYEGMKKNAMQATMIPWRDEGYITELEQCYFDKGFFPALPVREEIKNTDPAKLKFDHMEKMPYQITWMPEVGVKEWVKEVDSWHRRQSVSVTLEHCYDDWCLAQIAKDLGKDDDYKLFMKRAHNYQNLFNPGIGLMAPKSADGNWIVPFDPNYSGGFAGEGYFAEGNSWTYTWHVQHDVQGLINLMGGNDNFNLKLDSLFTIGRKMDKLHFLGQFPDMTGLIGMYTQGNEPAFHIPYLYNYSGQPWKTQSRVRQIMDLWFDVTPLGLSGDEDGGAMSSWYVFNAIGFYPQCPGRPIFDIGSPIFEKTIINVGNGKTFVVEAKNVSAQNKYIQSATFNGMPFNKPWFSNSDLVKGGKLIFEMGSRPNKNWGSAPDAAAPSMSTRAIN